jgi:hypothetical protein
MKTLKHLVFLLLLLPTLPTLRAQFLYWEYTNLLDEVREGGKNPDMVADAAGNLHSTFWNDDLERLVYGQRNAATGTWTFEYVDSTSVNGWVSSIALDPSGNPVVAYFESVSGLNQLRVSRRTGPNTWVKENIPGHPGRGHWGNYGPSDMINVLNRIVPSIDLVVTSTGKTYVLFLDMYIAFGSFPACSFSSTYGMRMWQAYESGSAWKVTSYGKINDLNLSCGGGSGSDFQLPFGDWYGSYVSATENPSGGLTAVTTSRYNSHILKFETTVEDTLWDTLRIDTMVTAVGGGWGPPSNQLNRYFTWENTHASYSPDGTLHTAYSSSMAYGDNFCCLSFNTLIYTRLNPGDTVGSHSMLTSGRYLNHVSLAAPSADTVLIAYSDLTLDAVYLSMSVDSGATWVLDTIYGRASQSSIPMVVSGGEIQVLVYDWKLQQMILSRRGINDPPGMASWTHEVVRQSAFNGASMDAVVAHPAGDTTVYVAHNEAFSGQLFMREGTRSGSTWSWSVTQPDTNCTDCKTVKMLLGNAGERIVLYNAGSPPDLRMAVDDGSGWTVSTVVAGADPGFLSADIASDDTIHIAYYSGQTHDLHHVWGTLGVWQSEVVDSTNDRVGLYCSLKLNAANEPLISYFNDSTLILILAEKTGGAWDTTHVYSNKPSAGGKFTSLGLYPSGQPAIAFLDEQTQKVWFAERDAALSWTFTLIDSAALFGIGRPINLEIDKFGNPWVAYNYSSSFDRVRLMHRDTAWQQVTVSTVGNIANSFRFMIDDNDLYLVGTKTAAGNTGMAMLYAARGLYIQTDDPVMNQPEVMLYPNPNQGRFEVSVSLPTAQSVSLSLHNLLGQPVAEVLPTRPLEAGEHVFTCEVPHLAPGIYLLQLGGPLGHAVGKVVITGL